MNDRIHRVLDGELDRSALTSAESAVLRATEGEIAAVLRSLPDEPLPDLAPAVLDRIDRGDAGRARQGGAFHHLAVLAAWLWSPRRLSVRVRPAYGMAAAALVALSIALGRVGPDAPPDVPRGQLVLTRFVLHAPEAEQVSLAGDFTGWHPAHSLSRAEPGIWTVVVPLEPGVHDYAFVVDGERWVPDPNAPAVDDGFGGLNSRLAVLAPDASAG